MERELVIQAQGGDRAAFTEVAGEIADQLYAVAYRILRDVDLAEDAAQQTIITVWRELPTLRDPDRFEPWAFRVLVRACYREARGVRNRPGDIHQRDLQDGQRDFAGLVADRDQLERGFRRLTTEQRTVIVLQHYLGYSLSQIAELMDVADRDRRFADPCRETRTASRARGRPALGRGTGSSGMNGERQLDRLLDGWLDEGPLVLPSPVFDEALRIVDRTPQRGRGIFSWTNLPMTRIAYQRAAIPVALIAVVAVAMLAAATIALLQPELGSGPVDTERPVVFAMADLQAVLPQPADAPDGTTYNQSLSGRMSLQMLAGDDGSVVQEWRELGFAGSWHSFFDGPNRTLGVAGLLWPDADSAGRALTIHRAALSNQVLGEEPVAASGLGDDATCISYTASTTVGGAGTACLFRVGNVTFFVPSGSGFEAHEVVRYAREVAARAASHRP